MAGNGLSYIDHIWMEHGGSRRSVRYLTSNKMLVSHLKRMTGRTGARRLSGCVSPFDDGCVVDN